MSKQEAPIKPFSQTEKKTVNILMTGGGAPGAAGILKCLEQNDSFSITVADANKEAIGKYLATDFETIPPASDPSFADKLLLLCRKRNIHVVMPLVTKELIPLSAKVNEFEMAGTKLLISSTASLDIANNKSRLYEFLEWRDIMVPRYKIVENLTQFLAAIECLGYPAEPVCFKPSVSNGSRGFRIIDQKADEADLLFNHKPSSTYISKEDAVRILSSAAFPELLVSEYLPGEEYSVDCLAWQGNAKLIVPRLRKKMINGITVEGEFVKEENIISYCKTIIHALQLHGNIGLQVKRAASGHFLLLEINPRVQGTIAAGLGAGINLPELAIKQVLDLPIKPEEWEPKWATRFARYWQEVFY